MYILLGLQGEKKTWRNNQGFIRINDLWPMIIYAHFSRTLKSIIALLHDIWQGLHNQFLSHRMRELVSHDSNYFSFGSKLSLWKTELYLFIVNLLAKQSFKMLGGPAMQCWGLGSRCFIMEVPCLVSLWNVYITVHKTLL